jgi:hypothetical protein
MARINHNRLRRATERRAETVRHFCASAEKRHKRRRFGRFRHSAASNFGFRHDFDAKGCVKVARSFVSFFAANA